MKSARNCEQTIIAETNRAVFVYRMNANEDKGIRMQKLMWILSKQVHEDLITIPQAGEIINEFLEPKRYL